jgi:hypothetical protein
MSCIHCGAETNPGENICTKCKQYQEVTVLSPDERENFHGLTIEQDPNGQEYYHRENGESDPRVFVRQFSFNSGKGSLLLKLLLGAGFLAVIILALPIALIFLAFFIINWLFLRSSR